MAKASRELEILVHKIQSQLAPDSEVVHDARLPGRKSGRSRQIDVLVRKQIGQYEMLIVIDCKDYARPLDVKAVEEFHGLVDDVGANKGALGCPKGFTKSAKERAKGWKIDLYSPVDTDPHKWQAVVSVPTVCEFRTALYSFDLKFSSPLPFMIPGPSPVAWFFDIVAYDSQNIELGVPGRIVQEKWDTGVYPTEPGTHEDLPIFDEFEVHVDNGYGRLAPVSLSVSLHIEQSFFYGELPIDKVSGFKDELSGMVIVNAFRIGLIDPDEVEREWRRIQEGEELPVSPVLHLTGLIGYASD